MPYDQVTLAITPRDRFSLTQRSLESVYQATDPLPKIVYVDGGSPAPVREYLEAQASQRGFQLIRSNEYLTANQSRNRALAGTTTKYVVFLDNDVIVSPGWLDALVACADETGADIVGPLYLEDGPWGHVIHMAGGRATIIDEPNRRWFYEKHFLHGVRLEDVGHHFRRGPIEMVEYHCMLVRMDIFNRLGSLDEAYLSCRDAIDLCLSVRATGGEVYFEPTSAVTFLEPPPIAPMDRDFFWVRWSESWNVASMNHFRDKWNLSDDDPSHQEHLTWLNEYRQLLLPSTRRVLRPLGRKAARFIDNRCVKPVERMLNRRRIPLHAPAHGVTPVALTS